MQLWRRLPVPAPCDVKAWQLSDRPWAQESGSSSRLLCASPRSELSVPQSLDPAHRVVSPPDHPLRRFRWPRTLSRLPCMTDGSENTVDKLRAETRVGQRVEHGPQPFG